MTVTATLHGGPRNGETFELPWARLELILPDWDSDREDLYRLRGPWRGQEWASYDFVSPVEAAA